MPCRAGTCPRRCRNYRLRINLPPMSLRGRTTPVAAQPFATKKRYGCSVPLAGAISCRNCVYNAKRQGRAGDGQNKRHCHRRDGLHLRRIRYSLRIKVLHERRQQLYNLLLCGESARRCGQARHCQRHSLCDLYLQRLGRSPDSHRQHGKH